MKKLTKGLLILLLGVVFLSGCREADRVSRNVSREADNFGVIRRAAVINMRSDEVVFEVIGNMSIETSDDRLELMVKVDEDTYKKHFINLTDWNMYVVEDLFGADVSNTQYEVNYNPEMVVPFDIIESGGK